MISASYSRNRCNCCEKARYADGSYPYYLPLFEVRSSWYEMKERVISSRYLRDYAGKCSGCLSAARGHTLVMTQLLYKLGLLDKLRMEL